jgi:hypothetical protein
VETHRLGAVALIPIAPKDLRVWGAQMLTADFMASDSGFAFMQLDVEREYPAFVRARWVSAST